MFLNVFMNLDYPAPSPSLPGLLKPSPETTALLGLICLTAWAGMFPTPALLVLFTGAVVFLRLFRMGETLMPMYFNRIFNLYLDSRYLPDLAHLLYHTVHPLLFWGALAGGLVFCAMLVRAIAKALKTAGEYFAVSRHRRLFAVLVAGLTAIAVAKPPDRSWSPFTPSFFHRVVEEANFILHVHGYRDRSHGILKRAEARASRLPASLDKLGGADVYLLFVESYGHTVLADPRHFSQLAPVYQDFEKGLRDRGYFVYSHFMESPTYGGASWLAHGTVASGVKLNNQMRFNLLVTSSVKPLAEYFNDAGYRTVSAMPGVTSPWPEGRYFGYRVELHGGDFPYRGPAFGWSPMPDQYVLHHLHQREIRHRRKPLFMEVVLVSSHAPFHCQPPYLADWSAVGDGSAYHDMEPVTYPVVWPDLTNATEAYVRSISYEIRVLGDFLKRLVRNDALVVVMGDHQPNVQITGEGCPWSVPVHAISRNEDLLKPFAARGFTEGAVPEQAPPHPGMENFLPWLLEDFSTDTHRSLLGPSTTPPFPVGAQEPS